MLAATRAFFSSKNILEVDCPLVSLNASIDAHIDLIPIIYKGKEKRYLHSSPEYGMKRLLAEGFGDCYQCAHVFRDGEYGKKHNPEFTLVEWYRIQMPFDAFIEETLEFVRLFLGNVPSLFMSYHEAFERYLGIDPHSSSCEDLINILKEHGIEDKNLFQNETKDDLLNLLLGSFVEPKLGRNELTVLAYYPETQAALAKTKVVNGKKLALRFEIYFKGVELANGYDELADSKEQKARLEEENRKRSALGKETLPIDYAFLHALEKGLPLCCGVAVGFDRLMMMRHEAFSLKEVIPFDWDSA